MAPVWRERLAPWPAPIRGGRGPPPAPPGPRGSSGGLAAAGRGGSRPRPIRLVQQSDIPLDSEGPTKPPMPNASRISEGEGRGSGLYKRIIIRNIGSERAFRVLATYN